jgi:hypothetical protein
MGSSGYPIHDGVVDAAADGADRRCSVVEINTPFSSNWWRN